jgi:hypothetical protein
LVTVPKHIREFAQGITAGNSLAEKINRNLFSQGLLKKLNFYLAQKFKIKISLQNQLFGVSAYFMPI